MTLPYASSRSHRNGSSRRQARSPIVRSQNAVEKRSSRDVMSLRRCSSARVRRARRPTHLLSALAARRGGISASLRTVEPASFASMTRRLSSARHAFIRCLR